MRCSSRLKTRRTTFGGLWITKAKSWKALLQSAMIAKYPSNFEENHETSWSPSFLRHRQAMFLARGDEGDRQETGRWLNNRAENSHQTFRRREWAMLRFRRMRTLQKFGAVHASVHNHFNQCQRMPTVRSKITTKQV